MGYIFCVGFKEFVCLCKSNINVNVVVDGIYWVMCVVLFCEVDNFESCLLFFVIVGFISFYIGLFGIVWGIMNVFIVFGEV